MNSIEEYRALIQHTSDVITVLNADGVITYDSPSVERVFGYEQSELVGENVFDYIHPDDRDRVRDAFSDAVTADATTIDRVEFRFERADGTYAWLESTASNQTNAELDGFVVTSRDVTARKRREAELDAERRKFESLAEGLSEVVYRADPETFDTTYVNGSIEALTGYTAAEWLADPELFFTCVHPEDRAPVREAMDALRADYEDGVIEYRLEARDGDVRWIRDHVSWERTSDGTVVAQIGVAYDVTETKEYQARLEETVAKLETLNRVVRHDIRNDMTIVLGWAELLEEHVDQTGHDYLEKILASGEHIVDLTNIARDYVEAVTMGDSMAVKPMSLRYVLETEIDLRRESFPDADITIEGAVPDVAVAGNEMLPSVFRNLVNNAVQHNDAAEPRVEVSVESETDAVVVTVADNGQGLPGELCGQLFDEGEKGLESGGTGMGLYLARRLVDGFGGGIWAENRERGGAAFHVRLPLVRESETASTSD